MSTIYLMNPHTGTVQTEAEWAEEGFNHDNAELVEVVKVAVKKVNDNGIEQIANLLGEKHKLGKDHFTDSMLLAWAEEVDDSLADGNGACFEIRAWDSVSGHTERCCITDEGLDTNEAWVDI